MDFKVSRYLSNTDKYILSRRSIAIRGFLFYVVCILIAYLINFIILAILFYWDINIVQKSGGIYMDMLIREKPLVVYSAMAFIMPMLEELEFRLWLPLKRWQISISIFVFSYIILTMICGYDANAIHNVFFNTIIFDSLFAAGWYKLLISAILCTTPFLINKDVHHKIKENKMIYKYVVLASAILFALVHVTNYNIKPILLFPMIILCLPQFVSGITLCYYRLNLGFWYAFLFHVMINSFGFIMALL